ncbi:hypothetical protein JX266_000052 [Neoarthrinium moseri]|uniref:uncharacterized protein n=1 Tax=Neoarthrinium moseri TaxID=1658444 RepID=UPI001FDB79FD|nr:uncharacterized protein JN550_002961 [Neoarthrinium moseri]KAI1855187.1 hypothetical protein JX266_000052 [Neoarthrinium moseri]KAI1873692.1 hypothetical protein JN550_002961 [Neoarthrinium moseri]
MPKQHTLFGRPVRLSPRRISLLLVGLGLFAFFTLFITLPSSIPQGPSLSKTLADHKIPVPKVPKIHNPFSSSILNPFRPAVHAPPEQKNSTYGGSSWYANWNWRSPFSSSVTLDENRSLLPPLKDRPPIYCYYDTTVQREKATQEAESDLLLTWRRAWWAQGFKPIILSAPEAINNPLYDELQRLNLEPTFKTDMMRWLAWENMGGGLLAHHLLFPMAPRDDAVLSYLRRGEYPVLSRWEGMDNALFAGTKTAITEAVTKALRHPERKDAKDFISAVSADTFLVDPKHEGLASYDPRTIETKFAKVGEQLGANRATGLQSLNYLINAHLHLSWLGSFPKGIAVVKPLPEHTTTMVQPALDLATWLTSCPDTPMPATCPPNLPKCSPCVATHPMKISTPARYRNTTGLYTIGTVPHPYTFAALNTLKSDIDIPWVRRKMNRDLWLAELTKEHLGTGVSGSARVITFKEAVAGDWATAHSIWLTAERETLPHDLDWYFGFAIPVNATDSGKSETPVPGPERRPKPYHDPGDGPLPTAEDLMLEPELMQKARDIGKSKEKKDIDVRNAIEAWNLADVEAWKFARAFLARSRVERLKWEEEERKYAGGAGSDKEDKRSGGWSRWTE